MPKVAAGFIGIVTDASGAVLAGSHVQAKSVETGIVHSGRRTLTVSSVRGLQPGPYDVEATQPDSRRIGRPGNHAGFVKSAKVLEH